MSATNEYPAEAIASVTAFYNHLRTKALPLSNTFNARYAAWKETWEAPTNDGAKKFEHLTSMGSKIIPLVVYRLCDPSEARAVELYNAIENNQEFQSQSPTAIIGSNYRRNQAFSELSAGWTAYKQTHPGEAQTAMNCDEYDDLVELGPSVAANAMLAYYDDKLGWWDELLCQVFSGRCSGPRQRIRDYDYRKWIYWFENLDGDDTAPWVRYEDPSTRY